MIVFTSRREQGLMILEPKGRLDTAAAPKLESALNDTLASDSSIVVDLGETSYISSMALRLLLFAAKSIAAKGKVFAIAAPTENIANVLRIAGFTAILHVHDTLQAALDDVRSRRH